MEPEPPEEFDQGCEPKGKQRWIHSTVCTTVNITVLKFLQSPAASSSRQSSNILYTVAMVLPVK